MDIKIRPETPDDHREIEELVKAAFTSRDRTDPDEHHLVNKLRKTDAFIPELSLVAVMDGSILGHIMLSKIAIEEEGRSTGSLALAPVSVAPAWQLKGIGGKLIRASLEKAQGLGYQSVVVLGHDKYYPKFGFKPASGWGIRAPFDVPDEAFMAIELVDDALDDVRGTVQYSEPFSG